MSHAMNDDPAACCTPGAEAAERGRWQLVTFGAHGRSTSSRPGSFGFPTGVLAMLASRAGDAALAVWEQAVMAAGAAYVTIVFSIADRFAKTASEYDPD